MLARRIVGCLVLLLALSGTAQAHMSPRHWHRGGDHVQIKVYRNVQGFELGLQVTRALSDYHANTVIDVRYVGSPADADVEIIEDDLPSPTAGTTELVFTTDSDGSQHLVKARVRLDKDLNEAGSNGHLARRVAAQEFGHALGLSDHDCASCGGVMLEGGSDWRLSKHDIADIDDFYRCHLGC